MTGYLGIVPARAGSKGIPRKNLQDLGGKPLVQYTLEAAAGARRLDEVVVSSDDRSVLELAERLEAGLVLERPERLARDDTAQSEVIRHALDWYETTRGEAPANVVLLQPTSPLRTARDVDEAIAEFERAAAESLITACPVSQHPRECFARDRRSGRLRFYLPEGAVGRQGYDEYLFVDGAVYVSTTARFRRTGLMFDDRSAVHLLPAARAIDVDVPFDLTLVRALLHYSRTVDAGALDERAAG